MKQISELPFRQRLTLGILYLVALGILVAAIAVSVLARFIPGIMIGITVEFLFTLHLIRRA